MLAALDPVHVVEGREVDILGIATYKKYLQIPDTIGTLTDQTYSVTPIHHIPLEKDGSMLIKFFAKPG